MAAELGDIPVDVATVKEVSDVVRKRELNEYLSINWHTMLKWFVWCWFEDCRISTMLPILSFASSP